MIERDFSPDDLRGDVDSWIADIAQQGCQPMDAAGDLLNILVIIEQANKDSRDMVIEMVIQAAYRHTQHFRDSLRDYLEKNCSNLLPDAKKDVLSSAPG